MKIREIPSYKILEQKSHDLLNEIFDNNKDLFGIGVKISHRKPIIHITTFKIKHLLWFEFKYLFETKILVEVEADNNNLAVSVSDWSIYPIIKTQFIKFAESNNIDELTFIKQFEATE
jgi:hypothetical protein